MNINIKIDKNTLDLLSANYITADEYIYLYLQLYHPGEEYFITPASIQKLKRMDYLDESNQPTGRAETIICKDEERVSTSDGYSKQFNELWLKFPLDDKYRNWPKTRPIRYNKAKTFESYKKVISKGVEHSTLLTALDNELKYRSTQLDSNSFKFMKISYNWLDSGEYENFLEIDINENYDEFGKQVD